MTNDADGVVIAANELTKVYRVERRRVRALDSVSFEVRAGETLAVIGESGSGKSTLSRLISGLEEPTSGTIKVSGERPRLRAGQPARAQLVFQDPAGSLNPYRRIATSVGEPLLRVKRATRSQLVGEMLTKVGIPANRHHDRPGQLSGGQLQRVAIARTLVARPKVLICDEPTSALDVSVQAQILNLLRALQQEIGFACVFVTHDLAVAQVVADRILVLRAGQVRELAASSDFFANPVDDYSKALIASSTAGAARPTESAGR
jgi:ABC-type glutathione transport system ATPase component